ncbi:MAG: AAA family ATPase [Phycisphaerales bacterium]|nr:AAA family ATPase [Phycisphaerales bacterium]
MNTLQELMEGSPLVQGGLILMAAGWVGYQLRAIPGRVFDLLRGVFTRVIEIREQNPLYDAWLSLLTESALRPGGPRTLEVRTGVSDDCQSGAAAVFAAGSDRFWARLCGKWCRVSVHREDSAGSTGDLVRRFIIQVEVLFGRKADLATMMRAAKARADVAEEHQLVDLCNKYGSRRTLMLPKRRSDTLCLPEGFYDRVEGRIREFLDSRDDYQRVGVPWRFGVLLYGEPGVGKTSLAHVLASSLGLRLSVVPLADLRSDEELTDAFEGVLDRSVVLLEDIDCAFNQRESEGAEGITFSGLLNCIDGMQAPHNGRILMMSTNHIDRLDPALIRPGRVDLRVRMPMLTRQAATDYVDRLFPHMASRHDIVDRVMREPAPTAAMLINELMREDWRRGQRPSRASEGGSAREALPA